MNCNYTIEISKLAAEDLLSIFDYIKNTLNAETAANNLIEKIMHNIELLTDSPEMCPLLNNASVIEHQYRKLIVNNYVIIYQVNHLQKKIFIVRAFYGAMDYEKFL